MPSREELKQQARQHLDSLRAAGVEWLPAGTPTGNLKLNLDEADAAPPVSAGPASKTQPAVSAEEVSSPPSLDLDQRRVELQVLAKKVAGCTLCGELASTRTQTVFGVGQPGVELCFIGEAPGADEDAQGEPFVGAAGQLLNKIIAACGMKREEVYICNILRCRPPGNRTPNEKEAGNCRPFLEKQLELVAPKYICALGACAAQNLLGTTLSIGKLRGALQSYKGIPVLCTYHPAYLLRNPPAKKDVWEDMQKLMAHMGRPVPKTKG